MTATIHDVARRAGVSISTVSRVLNGSSPVNDDKRALVLEAVKALDYAPNPAALSLLGKRTGGIGVLLPFVTGEFFSELLSGLDEAAQDAGRFLVVSTSHCRTEEFRRAARALDKRVDALIVAAPETESISAASILSTGVPVAFLNTRPDDALEADVFNFDNYGGVRDLTGHLQNEGHRRIAYVRGPAEAWDAQERVRGYRDAMDHADLEATEIDGGYSREAGHAAAAHLLAMSPRPTAVIGANDYCALGLMSALHQANVAVPGEISVCGFDGLPSTGYTVPALTTVHVPIREIGARAVRRVVSRINERADPEPYRHEVAPVTVVVRDSTTPADAEALT
ncbi:LacI family DNA-binding transcriptional regulator [Rubrivirga sp.]|uniref:LacI family DNA-binding transcriptional regulator n=1 Tax=Rubrivirga sp. TaxID=1885344 RepID=UPI003C73C224